MPAGTGNRPFPDLNQPEAEKPVGEIAKYKDEHRDLIDEIKIVLIGCFSTVREQVKSTTVDKRRKSIY